METIHNRVYDGIIIGIAIRGSIADSRIFRVRRGNGFFDAKLGKFYQDQYAYFVPGSINNAASQPYRANWRAAVTKWKFGLTAEEKTVYNTRANRGTFMSGFNLFMREAMNGKVSMYVDRGDPAAYDFDVNDFTDDGTWRVLDLSAIIPVSARAILLDIDFKTANAFKHIQLRKTGQSNAINHFNVMTVVGNQNAHSMAIVAVTPARSLEYNIDNATWANLDATIRGWWT